MGALEAILGLFKGQPIFLLITMLVILIGIAVTASKLGYIQRTGSSWTFGRQHLARPNSLAGEWKGTFHVLSGRGQGTTAEYTLVIVEHLFRSCSGILLYEAYDPTAHKRVSAGADMLLPDRERHDPVSNGKWQPTFKRCVHWQPPEDARPADLKELDEQGQHIYEWDVEVGITANHARMKVRIRATKTGHESEGILEKHV